MQLSFTDKVLAKFVPALSPHGAAPTPDVAPVASVVQPFPSAVAPAATQPVEDASFAAKLFGKVGLSQNTYLANQQMLGQVSATLGARLTQVTTNVMQLLRGSSSTASTEG